MKRGAAALIVALCATPATAQDLPALHDVTGVAQDDVLNVRAGPTTDAPIIGTLAPGAEAVEVTQVDGGWARVNSGERSGWAALRYLQPVPGGAFPAASTLACLGTEPFWRLDIVQNGPARFSGMDGPVLDLRAGDVMPGANVMNRFGIFAAWPGGSAAVSLRRETCSDGMSDRLFGLSADVILGGGPSATLSGCCSVVQP